jgi:predicted NBD/HSP70 family sugar kinase
MQSGTNLTSVRDYNELVILEAIRRKDALSRVEIAQQTGLTAQTISNVVKRLLSQGMIREDGKCATGRGKHRIQLMIRPDAGYAIGVQIERYETTAVIVDLLGRPVARHQQLTRQSEGADAVIQVVATMIEHLVQQVGIARERIVGIGVACPGPLDHLQGIVYNSLGLIGWQNVPLKAILEEKTGLPVVIDRDATAAAIGEHWARRDEDIRNFAFFYVGGGIGTGLFLEKRIFRGSATMAGIIGHMTLDLNGPLCSCGNRGCVGYTSDPHGVILALQEHLRQGASSSLTLSDLTGREDMVFEKVCDAAVQGDVLTLEELRSSAHLQGYAILNLIHLLDVELVVIGGPALDNAIGDLYVEEVRQVLRERLLGSNQRTVRVERTVVGADVGSIGAASLMLHTTYTPQLKALNY